MMEKKIEIQILPRIEIFIQHCPIKSLKNYKKVQNYSKRCKITPMGVKLRQKYKITPKA